MNTFTLGACFQHKLYTGPYFMTFAPRLYIHLDYVHYTQPTLLAEKVVKGLKYGTLQPNHGLHHSNQNG